MIVCSACGTVYEGEPERCAVCCDDRQYVPADGQQWTSWEELLVVDPRLPLGRHELPVVLADRTTIRLAVVDGAAGDADGHSRSGTRSSSDTDSTCGVCGNMSTGRVRVSS